jgi:hypothetical protein
MGVLIQYHVASSVGYYLTYGYIASTGIDTNHAIGDELALIAGKASRATMCEDPVWPS